MRLHERVYLLDLPHTHVRYIWAAIVAPHLRYTFGEFRMKLFTTTMAVATIAIALAFSGNTKADIVYSTNFNAPTYTDGGLIGQDAWLITGASTTNPINVANVGTDGNVTLTNNGQDVRRAYTNNLVADLSSISLSADVIVTAALATGDYFMHLGNNSDTIFQARVYAKSGTTAGTFQLAMGTSSGTAGLVYGAELSLNSLFNIRAQYDIVSGLANDTGTLFVNGNSYIAALTTGTDALSFASVSLRQGTAASAPSVIVDNIVVTTVAIPEPTTAGLGLIGLAGMMMARRRRIC